MNVGDGVRILGVVLDRGRTFSSHVTETTKRVLGRLRGFYGFKLLLPEPAKLNLIQSFILLVFLYCCSAYGNSISGADITIL